MEVGRTGQTINEDRFVPNGLEIHFPPRKLEGEAGDICFLLGFFFPPSRLVLALKATLLTMSRR